MWKSCLILLVLGSTLSQDNGGDVDKLLAEIFGNPSGSTAAPSTNPPASSTKPTPSRTEPPRPSTSPASDSNRNDDNAEDKSCVTENNEPGECVPYYLCDSNNTVINDGVGIIDIRVRDSSCKSYLDTCCQLPDKRKPDNPIKPTQEPEQQKRVGCGWRNTNGIGFRITGDTNSEAGFGEFPWMVAILKIEPVRDDDPDGQKLNVYVGGGSLIHPSVVLTVAHYVNKKGQTLKCRAGEWDTQTKAEIYPYQDRNVQGLEIHKDFNSGNLFYDVAVLYLDTPMDLAPNVQLVCLPPPREVVPSGTRCFASGWGKDQFGKEGRYQVILKKVEVPVVDRNTCQSKLRQTRLGSHFMLHSSFMCAGGEPGHDTCKGDGGSPLVCPIEYEKGRYMQSGIVAWGIGCGDTTPAVYVDVSNLRDWIDNAVAGRGYDPKTYTIE